MAGIDPIVAINLILCIVILVLGYLGYRKSKNKILLYVGIAFALFGVSHAVTLLGIQGMTDALLVIRTVGYLTVVYALLSLGKK
jgi:Na+/proline symporter